MDKRYTFFGFLSQIFMIYGITTGLLNIFCLIFGENAIGYSTIFSLANSGIGVGTSFQFLLAMTITVTLRMIFMTDILIKKMPLLARIISMFVGTIAVIVAFIFIFDWFPANEIMPWIMFAICFVISCTASVLISTAAERLENRRLEEALKRSKEAEND